MRANYFDVSLLGRRNGRPAARRAKNERKLITEIVGGKKTKKKKIQFGLEGNENRKGIINK